MGTVELKWCDHFGIKTSSLNRYIQVTDFQLRTTEWDRGKNTLEMCDACFEKSKKNFESLRKYTAPRQELSDATDAEKKKKKSL